MFGFGKRKTYAACILAVLLAVVCAAASAASLEKVYGITKGRIRVREKASLNAVVTDNLKADACVYLLTGKISGGTTFAKVRYRTAEGKLETGWVAQKSGGKTYVSLLTSAEAKKKFGVSGGKLPSAAAGVMSKTERAEIKSEGGKAVKEETAETKEAVASESSKDVKEAQEGLKALGLYSGNVTGHCGDKTVSAIKAFQKSKGLSVTGKADSKTLAAIKTAKAAKSKSAASSVSEGSGLKLNSKGSSVKTLQKNLKKLGYYYGDVTGNYGEKTARAVRLYQKDQGFKVTGTADKTIQKKIASAASKVSSAGTKRTGSGTVYNLNWFKAKKNGLFPKIGFGAGKTATLKDLKTGKTLEVRIQSSGSHLDVEPLTDKDTKIFCSIYGVTNPKKISARRRPMLLTTVHGYRIVCSCYGQPHGDKMVYGNNYKGQFCLHFLNSKTSGTSVVDNAHQEAVRQAVGLVGSSHVAKLSSAGDLK